MFAIDTNLLVYAHNSASPFNDAARSFLEKIMNERDREGQLAVCIPAQVFMEFIHIVTWERLESPISLSKALQIVHDYIDAGVRILVPQAEYIHTFLELCLHLTTRKRIFDVAIAATLKDNGIKTIYTANIEDFGKFDFLEVINPLLKTL